MSRYGKPHIQIADLYRAYRKAKVDAFYESSHFHALAFARYEKSLHQNLKRLQAALQSDRSTWFTSKSLIGGFAYVPKTVNCPDLNGANGVHFSTLDHMEDWRSAFASSGELAEAKFRQIITPTVDYQIIAALWIMEAGFAYDGAIDSGVSYGNRLRRNAHGLNLDCSGLFKPYFSAYRDWRERGLKSMRKSLERGREIFAVTMDVRQFYHSVDASFCIADDFLGISGVALTDFQRQFTADLVASIDTWYQSTPDAQSRGPSALPVGLSASKILSNVFLIELDRLVVDELAPIYYGRYVDDIFLVLEVDQPIRDGKEFMRWVAGKIGSRMSYLEQDGDASLRYEASFSPTSEIVFAGGKQKIFHLRGRTGLDLVDQITEQIRRQSSEHRLLPLLARTESEMLSHALLATPDATLEADALRKADAVSIRKLGFSLLLRDVETYARDLRPREWRKLRKAFYGLVLRHVITPRGYFDYLLYVCRTFGLAVACGDVVDARALLARFREVCDLLRETTTAGTSQRVQFESAVSFYGAAFLQVALQASTVKGFRFDARFFALLKEIRALAGIRSGLVLKRLAVKQASRDLLVSDLGRRSYREYWFRENRIERNAPSVPKQLSVHRILRLGLIRDFRKSLDIGLNAPYWPAVAFATRPLTLPEITTVAPGLLARPKALENAIFGLRGAKVRPETAPYASYCTDNPARPLLYVPSLHERGKVTVGVTSHMTTDEQWLRAYRGKPDRGLERYEDLRTLVNSVLASKQRADYLVFPELSLPRRWAFGIAIKLAKNGTSLVAGLENNNKDNLYRNDALVSLATRWPGYQTHVQLIQPKIKPAHHEGALLINPVRKFYKPASIDVCRPIYVHGNHAFGVLICSDLTTIENRAHYQGAVDTLFVVEWNPDINTFSYLVESASHDLHAYIVQANNREYGDSRIRGPFAKDFKRDVVRVRGGDTDYHVVAEIDIDALRKFQARFVPTTYQRNKDKEIFKPLPIGFPKSSWRKLKGRRR